MWINPRATICHARSARSHWYLRGMRTMPITSSKSGGGAVTKVFSAVRRLSVVAVGVFVASGGCSSSSKEGITLAVLSEAPRSAVEAAGTRTFDTDRGVRVTLTRGYLSTGSVEIFGCAAETSWRWLEPFFLREARAHVVGSPTRLGIPAVESLLADPGTRMELGELHPPPRSYCKVKQTILAADSDALGLPSDGSMLGKSLLVAGTYVAPGGAPHEFHFTSAAPFDVETTVEETALSVDERRAASLVLVKTSERWFDGVDFSGDENEATMRILANLRVSLGAHIE